MMKPRQRTVAFALVLGATTLLATLLHAIETAAWAVAYCVIGAIPDFKSAMLYSLGAMTTYGHEDLFLEHRWRLLGTIEALNGWLLFGLSTAVLFSGSGLRGVPLGGCAPSYLSLAMFFGHSATL